MNDFDEGIEQRVRFVQGANIYSIVKPHYNIKIINN